MVRHQNVHTLIQQAYEHTDQEFGRWMWQHHVPVVAAKALELSEEYHADQDIAVAGALLHDFGDAFVHRFDPSHPARTETESRIVLQKADYSSDEIEVILQEVIAPHSCKDGNLPKTIEAKVVATADALAHLSTDFYLQFAWLHLPEGKSYSEYRQWVTEKIDRDFRVKIQFDAVQDEYIGRYLSLRDVFAVAAV